MSLDNSSCNLASINLLKFLRDDDTFDAERFRKVTELIITAMDISISFADFPTEKIAETTRAYRQLGIGYANLGALLMATGHAYDSEGGQAIAAAITSLMTGAAYKTSAELAAAVGPYDGYARNAKPHKRVIRKHADAGEQIRPVGTIDREILDLANATWQECIETGEANGYRNAQASLLAPTGCMTADTLVTTDRGLVRLGEIGDVYGDRWQDLDLTVSTDQGPRRATKFFVNGEEPTRRIRTEGGYKVQGTLAHRVKIVNASTGAWEWKRLADIAPGDVLPMQMRTLVGEPRHVPLPVLDQAYYAGDRHVRVPDMVTRSCRTRRLLHGRRQPARQGNQALRRRHRPGRRRTSERRSQGTVRTRARHNAARGIPGADSVLGPARALVAGRGVRQEPAGQRAQR
jgi:ribonucleoside-diphosphate reductase alpha chain